MLWCRLSCLGSFALSDHRVHGVEGGTDDLVHVEVLIHAEAPAEDHVLLLIRKRFVLFVQRCVLLVVDGVIGLHPLLPGGGVLSRDDGAFHRLSGLAVLSELEVLVLDDPREGHFLRRVVDHRISLVVVTVGEFLGLELQAPVLQRAVLVVEERIDHAGVDHVPEQIPVHLVVGFVLDLDLGGTGQEVLFKLHWDVLQELLRDLGIAAHRDALVAVIEVVIVVDKAERKALDDKRRKLRAGASPLLFRVLLDELFVDVPPAEGERLFLQVLRVGDACFLHLLFDDGLCFVRGDNAPHLREGVHVEGKVVELVMVAGDRGVDIVVELCKLVYVLPDLLVGGVEDVRTVPVHLNAVYLFRVDVSRDVVPAVDHLAGFSRAVEFVGTDTAKQAGTDNQIIIGHNEYRRGNPAACSGEERRSPFSNKRSGMMQYPQFTDRYTFA